MTRRESRILGPHAHATLVTEIGASVPIFLAFVVIYVVLVTIVPPTPGQFAHSDPLVQLMYPLGGVWSLSVLSIVIILPWGVVSRPQIADLRSALAYALFGAAVASTAVAVLRLGFGPILPSFIPPEESAAPGLVLGLGAGMVEEAIFRYAVLPIVFLALAGRVRTGVATGIAIMVTGLAFAALHDANDDAGRIDELAVSCRTPSLFGGLTLHRPPGDPVRLCVFRRLVPNTRWCRTTAWLCTL